MAGKNQHHVWQLIQRGFGEKRGKHHHIWIYKKRCAPRQTSTRKYGVEPFYFSDDNDNTADNVLTNFENSIQSRIQELRKARDGASVESDFMAPFITHLEMRSQFLREEISSLGERLITGLTELLLDEKKAANMMFQYLQNHPELLEDELEKHGISDDLKPSAKAMVETKIPSLIKEQTAPLAEMARTLLAPAVQRIPHIGKRAQLQCIGKGFTEIERTNTHHNMNYRLCISPEDIILPDTGLAFFKRKGLAPLSQKGDEITDVIIPIGSNSYIYGFRNDAIQRSAKTINNALASCSYQSFIARDDNLTFRKMAGRIGRNATLISDAEINKMISFDNLIQNL